MGEGVQQRRGRHRFGEAYAGDGPETLLAEKMDSGAHLRMVGPEQEAEQRLREAAGERRSFHLRSHESPDGEEIGTLMRVFRQFQHEVLRRIPLPRTWVNRGVLGSASSGEEEALVLPAPPTRY